VFLDRFFFRQQQEEERQRREQERRSFFKEHQSAAAAARDSDIRLEEFDDEDEDTDDVDGDGSEEKLSFDGSTRERAASSNPIMPTPKKQTKKKNLDLALDGDNSSDAGGEGVWLLRAARDAERRAASQWRKKARDLHHELQIARQSRSDEVEKVREELEERYQALCSAYETRMTEVTMQIDDSRAAGYDAGIRESEEIIAAMRQATDEEIEQLRAQLLSAAIDGGEAANSEQLRALVDEKMELQKLLTDARERLTELEKRQESADNSGLEQTLAELKKEMELWRMRALKMKKLKDLIQTELNNVRNQNQSSSDSADAGSNAEVANLRARVADLESQLAEATAKAQVCEKEAYDRGVATGRIDAEEKLKTEVTQAFDRGVEKGAEDSKSEIGLLKAELAMFRAFHESAAQLEIPSPNLPVDESLDDISLADGIAPCSPGSSVSIFNGDFGAAAKPSDDWGEW